MIEKISRDICLIKYRKLPLCEYDELSDEEIFHYPKVYSSYWLKSLKAFKKTLPKEIVSLIKVLKTNELIFFGEVNKPWISKKTKNRKDFSPLIKAIKYFKKKNIKGKFNGGVKVELPNLQKFIKHFITITVCDGGFYDFKFIDEEQNYIFHIHYSGEIKVLILNKSANTFFLKKLNKTNFKINTEI